MKVPAWFRVVRVLSLEACATLFLVLLLFCAFLVLLYAVFPSGTPLKELFEGSLDPASAYAARSPEATLSGVRRDVRYRRGSSIAWSGADEGLKLYSQDAVQTLDRSGATIAFGSRDRLSLGSNSLVVVTRLDTGDESGERSYRVQVAGEVRGNLSAARKLQLEIAAAGHLARLKSGAARFRLTPNDDNSASLAVYAGELQFVGGAGVRVPANYAVTLKQGAPVGKVLPLPPAPQILGPQPARYSYRQLPPQLRLAWSGPAGSYHLQLSRTQRFETLLLDLSVEGTEYRTDSLTKGSYFWRVSRREEGREGPFSSTGRCQLEQRASPPGLTVDFPPERTAAGPYRLSGSSEPGSRVFVDGIEIPAGEDGGFSYSGELKPGVNLIRVEALDQAGNASYASAIVYGRL
jgi:hypothetical protein